MDLLSGTPYLLDDARASRVLKAAVALHENVLLLRRNGALDAETLQRLRHEWGYLQVHESAAIEGNSLDLSETIIAIQRGITISGKPPEHSKEVQNLHSAIQFVETLAKEDSPVSEREVCELQSLIVGRDQDEAGKYRSIEVSITNSPHKPPHPLHVPEQMRAFAAWLKASAGLPIALLSAVTHAWLVHIHPFRDGNGRSARAIGNLQLIRAGYPIVVIRRKDRQRYYEALRASDDGDITPFLELVVDRSGDSLRQIDRVRQAVQGVSLAIEKVLESDRRQYQLWAAGISLLAKTIGSTFKDLETPLSCRVDLQSYDMPSEDDYRALTKGSPDGNTWLERVTVKRGAESRTVLLWIGYSSDALTRALGVNGRIPSVKLSTPNAAPPPAWIETDDAFPSAAREFAYHDGRFWRLEKSGADLKVLPSENVQVLAAKFASELIEGWFTRKGSV